MSLQSARDFLSKVSQDEEFRRRLGDCATRAEQQQLAQEAGFDFTSDEMRTARSEMQDDDLDLVSGAGCCACENDVCTSIET